MDIKNQQGGLVAKTKSIKSNPRKLMQTQINEIGGATSSIIGELRGVNNHLIGLEALILNLAEFLGKKDEFIVFVEDKIKEIEKEKEEKKVVKEG
tara:strand:- start:68 stop:352 length:285 start_codon:yes stop_codon:yes gene_type:complete